MRSKDAGILTAGVAAEVKGSGQARNELLMIHLVLAVKMISAQGYYIGRLLRCRKFKPSLARFFGCIEYAFAQDSYEQS
jgi:hypothetical protein